MGQGRGRKRESVASGLAIWADRERRPPGLENSEGQCAAGRQ